MDKTLVFKWISLVENGENFSSLYQEDLTVSYTYTKVSLPLVAELVKQTEIFENISLSLGSDIDTVFIDGLTTSIRLRKYGNAGHFHKKTVLTGNGPSLKWLLENTVEINNPNPHKVLYTDDMVVYLEPFKSKGTTITFLKIDDIKSILKAIKNFVIEWLDYETFNTFLTPYGYTNRIVNNDIALILMTYRCAKQLEFKDPKEVVGHFCDRRLVAELTLKGVFDKLLED